MDLKTIVEKFIKFEYKILWKKIINEMKDCVKNIYKSYQNEPERVNLYLISRMIYEETGYFLIGNSNIEYELFENTLLKTN